MFLLKKIRQIIHSYLTFFQHIRHVIAFSQLPRYQRQLIFYSEGRTYWPHFKELIHACLHEKLPICYISSHHNDPGLQLKHPHYRSFKIDEGAIRNWLFANIDTDIMVMTMPDLHQYQVKRSRHPVHYIYLQHSLVSLHMVYRPGAFDHYNTIFCAGPHHIAEIKAMEKYGSLPAKTCVKHGYARLDAILERTQPYATQKPIQKKTPNAPRHVLIAPSWGKHGFIESGLAKLVVAQLLGCGFQVTLRPHPQTFKFASRHIQTITQPYLKNSRFTLEENVASQTSLHQSDIMISDWSGAALDYAFGLEKPVVFIDIPRKINNPDYDSLNIEPLELSLRKSLGSVVSTNKLSTIPQVIEMLLHKAVNFSAIREQWVFNIGHSNQAGKNYLMALLGQLKDDSASISTH